MTRPGRKPEYCEDRRWEDGKTCKQMGQAEQRAERAAGLDVPLAAYQAATERLASAPALAELRDRIDRVLISAADVDTAALARVRDAEEAMSEAIGRAQAAEAAQKAAEDRRADALRQAKADREALAVAERRVRDAERELEESTTAAWRKVIEAETAKGAAEGQRDEAKANLRAYIERFDELATRANELTDANKKLTRNNARLEAEAKAQKTAFDELQERWLADVARLEEQLDQQRRAAEEGATRAAQEHDAAMTTLRQELDGLREKLGAETARAETAERDRDTASDQAGRTQARVAELEEQAERHREELTTLRARIKAVEEARDQVQQGNATLQAHVDELRDQLGAARGRTQTLEEAAERDRAEKTELQAKLAEAADAAATAHRELDAVQRELDAVQAERDRRSPVTAGEHQPTD
ncbi:hypothetical protein [Saccharothrix obliqua]|uniref:hypothetical protein n=1 Tax=Saccharothrix obliqua TaxID=2861747 RepID=UPI001C5EBA44|nr:hypothetical protein [Saccharothrix obliqua]MBW4722425.1 hypothetical protein [Saccharothrix obliqua]